MLGVLTGTILVVFAGSWIAQAEQEPARLFAPPSSRALSAGFFGGSGSRKRIQIKRLGEHRQAAGAVARPSLARSVPIQLHTVSVRVFQVESFADAVVGSAVELYPSRLNTAQRV